MAVLAGAEAAGGGGAAAGGGAAGGGAAGGGAGAGGAGGGKGLGAKAKKAGALHLAGKALKQHKAKEGKQSSRTMLILLIVFMFLLTPVMVVLLAFSVIAGGCDDQAATSSTGTGTTSGPGSGAISTSGEQKSIDMTSSQQAIARTIVQTVSDLGLPRRAAEISLATALLESTLSANPKPSQLKSPKYSVGLFQQQGPWGPVKFRLDPRKSTILFLVGGVGWPRRPDRRRRMADPAPGGRRLCGATPR